MFGQTSKLVQRTFELFNLETLKLYFTFVPQQFENLINPYDLMNSSIPNYQSHRLL